MLSSPAFYAAIFGPVVVLVAAGLGIYCRLLVVLLKERSQRSSYHVNSEPISQRKDDKSHRVRWSLFRRSFCLYVLIFVTWLLGLQALRSTDTVLHYFFTISSILEGLSFFFVHCYLSKDGRKEAADGLRRVLDKVAPKSKQYNVTNMSEEKTGVPVIQLQNATSMASVVSSDLSVNSLEMTRLSPLGASDTNINQSPLGQRTAPPSTLTIPNKNVYVTTPLSSPGSQYSQVDIDDAIRRVASGSKPIKSPVSPEPAQTALSPVVHSAPPPTSVVTTAAVAAAVTATASAAPAAASSATSQTSKTGILRGALKKRESSSNNTSRSNSMKRRRKKSVSWKLQAEQYSNDEAVDSSDEVRQSQVPKKQEPLKPSNLGGRRAMRRKQNGSVPGINGNLSGSPLTASGPPSGHYPQKYTMKSSWTGQGKLPDMSGLSGDPSASSPSATLVKKANGTARGGAPAPPHHAPTARVKGRRLSGLSSPGQSLWSPPNRAIANGGPSPPPNQRRRVSPLPVSFIKRLSVSSELEVPSSGVSTPAGTATPGLHWTSRSPEPSLLENSCSSDEDRADTGEEHSDSDVGNDEFTFSVESSTPLTDSVMGAMEGSSSKAVQEWAFGKSVVERLQKDPDVDEVFEGTSDEATVTMEGDTGDDDDDDDNATCSTADGSGGNRQMGAEWRIQTFDADF